MKHDPQTHVKISNHNPPVSRDILSPVIAQFARLGVICRNMADWRVAVKNKTFMPYGTIQGLDTLRGRALVTDSVEVLVEQPGGVYYFGHWQYFIADKPVEERKPTKMQKLKDKYKQ